MQQRFTDFDALRGYRTQFEALAIGQDNQADQALALARNAVQVELHQSLATADPCPLLDQQGKTFAVEFHGVDAHVHQQLGTVLRADRQRVPGAGDMNDLAIAGRVQAIIERIDGDTVAHGAAGEHFVGNVAQGQQRTTEWGAKGQFIIVVGHGHGTHQENATQ